jgi:hypothetical protein
MNKKGLLGTIILGIVIILAIVGALIYFQLKNEGVQLSSGDFQIDIKYNSSNPEKNPITGDTILEINETLEETQESNTTEESSSNLTNSTE